MNYLNLYFNPEIWRLPCQEQEDFDISEVSDSGGILIE